jgi:glucose-6-phosphate dehydrogenase assembly protein OpcA
MAGGMTSSQNAPLWRPSTPEQVESDLAALWREAAGEGAVSRALMSNLIIVAECAASLEDITSLGDERPVVGIARRHPARTILLGYTPGMSTSSQPKSASVAVLTFGSPPVRYGVELVAVHAACADASIPSIVRNMVIGDLPTTVWWASDFSRTPSAASAAVITGMARQVVYDSARWSDIRRGAQAIVQMLDRPYRLDIADLTWRRLTTLRRAIVHGVRTEVDQAAGDVPSVIVRYAPGRSAMASLMTGWLRSRVQAAVNAPEEAGRFDGDLEIELSGPNWQFKAAMKSACVTVSRGDRPIFTMPVPHESDAEALAAELVALSGDRGLVEAVRAIATA